MSHTPAPWRFNPSNRRIEYGPIVAGDGFNVAEIRSDYHEPVEANAYLIAAAPELLAACKIIAKWIRGQGAGGAFLPHLDAAITQAEGRNLQKEQT